MAKYNIASGAAEAKQIWDEELFRDVVKESFFMSRFADESGNNAVHVKRDFTKTKGETKTFTLRMRLNQPFIVDGQSEGNEYSISTYTNTITLHKYRLPIRDNGELTRMRPPWNVTDEQRAAVQECATENLDQLCFDAVALSPTRVFYSTDGATPLSTATAATAKTALTTNSLIFPKLVSYVKTAAKTGIGRTYVPIRPIKVDGKDYYIMVVHPDCLYDLMNNTTFQTAMREALERGKDNPIFAGAKAITSDGVIIHESEFVATGTDAGAGSNVPWAKCVFFGAQALLFEWGRTPTLVTKDFDYEDQIGMDWSFIGACKKPVFNSLDFGSFGVYLARTNISG